MSFQPAEIAATHVKISDSALRHIMASICDDKTANEPVSTLFKSFRHRFPCGKRKESESGALAVSHACTGYKLNPS